MTNQRRRTKLGSAFMATALTVGGLGLVSCAPGFDMVRTDPALYPIFQLSVTDYVNRCDPPNPTDVTVNAPDGMTVSIDGQPTRGGTFSTVVAQQFNEAFQIVVTSPEATTTHYVRCLPPDFPQWEATRDGTPQAEFYATTIITGSGSTNTPAIFDTNGVPVWWTEPQATFLLTPLPNDNLATMNLAGGMVERQLDGTVERVLDTQGAPSDFHDVLLLPNGNYVLATFEVRPCDLSAWGEGPADCAFHDFQELTPSGQVVWNWRPEEDIPVIETSVKWRSEGRQLGYADPWHYNSVEWTGDGFIISFRHMDAIYKIDYASRNVVWKLGGSTRAESLQVVGDPIFDGGGSISGPHDARLVSADLVSLFDNGSRVGRAPRSVAYRIDEAAQTATLERWLEDPIAPGSGCCGSTRVLAGSNVVTGWGGTPWITENQQDGTQVFRLNSTFVYRGIPIEPGWYSRDDLRAGMDAQYDGGVIVSAATAQVRSADPALLDDLATRLGLE
jgi:hypothetical protein